MEAIIPADAPNVLKHLTDKTATRSLLMEAVMPAAAPDILKCLTSGF